MANIQSSQQQAEEAKRIRREKAIEIMTKSGNNFDRFGEALRPSWQDTSKGVDPNYLQNLGLEIRSDDNDGNFGFYQDNERLGDAYDYGGQQIFKRKKSALGKILGDIPGVNMVWDINNSISDHSLDKGFYQIERLLGGHGGRSEKVIPPDQISDIIRRVQKKASGFHEQGLDEYQKEFGRDSAYDSEANTEVEQGVRGLLKERQATGRGLQEGISRRGTQGTTAGLSAMSGSDQSYGSNISALRSDIKNRVNNLKKARSEKGMELSSSVLQAQDVPIDFYGQKKERMGGVLPLIGGLTGAYFGSRDGQRKGGAGFQAGMGLGQYMEGSGGY